MNESLPSAIKEEETLETSNENGATDSEAEEDNDENDSDGDVEKFDPLLDNLENVPNWSCDDVYRYFKHYFPDYAHLFREQVKQLSNLMV